MNLYERIHNNSAYIIAEMSANHAGSLQNALRFVEEAKWAGADCVKIQTYTADTITIDCDNEYFQIKGGPWDGYSYYSLYQQAHTPWAWQAEIKKKCGETGIDFLSTPFDNTAVDFLEGLGVEFYKIASFELVDIPLIEYIASKGKPMIISCGMAAVEEIEEALAACKRQNNDALILLKCCSEYPASYGDMNIATLVDMKRRFGFQTGLSDHSMGHVAAVVAVSLGACVIEKHMCLDRSIPNPDSGFSQEPEEFKQMVDYVRLAELARGEPSYALSPREEAEKKSRRSLFAVKPIQKGALFTEENLRSIRPNSGLAPKYYHKILGKKAACDIEYGTPMRLDFVEDLS